MNDTAALHLPRLLCTPRWGHRCTHLPYAVPRAREAHRTCIPSRLCTGSAYRGGARVGHDVCLQRLWALQGLATGVWTSRDIPAVIDAAIAPAMTADDTARATGDWVGLLGSQRWQLAFYSGSRGAGGPASGPPFSCILRQKSQLRCLRQRRGAKPLC